MIMLIMIIILMVQMQIKKQTNSQRLLWRETGAQLQDEGGAEAPGPTLCYARLYHTTMYYAII